MPINDVRTLKRKFETGDYIFTEIFFTSLLGLHLTAEEISPKFLEGLKKFVDTPESRKIVELRRSLRLMTLWTDDPRGITSSAGSCNFLQ